MIILKPTKATVAYESAAKIFRDMYERISGIRLKITEEDDGASDLIVIGADDVSDFCMHGFLEGRIPSFGIRYGTDDYCMRSYTENGRRITILAGGRGRSTLYAVYDYFERFAGCSYYWDGDCIPRLESIETRDFDIVESPRFEYRGMRFFAHRGLKRFQAELWSFEDWKQELNFMLKRRMNFFMMRIGMDDLWQRAFPDIVPYPDGYTDNTDKDVFFDRSDFWTLKHRGELREKILSYARDMDMIYPTDCGTLTHWYSMTPDSYLKAKKPSLFHQEDGMKDNERVWNFLEKEGMEEYIKLTRTMVEQYEKRTDYFHTIGLGERYMLPDKDENFRLKIVAYRRMMETLRRYYPNSKLFLGAWDLAGFWHPDDAKKLIKELDPERTVILDYTGESKDPKQIFLNWDMIGKFPWIFGLFHAFCSDSELRGPYDLIDERLLVAKNDPFCQGMVLWPELAHSDPIILEYLARNAWNPLAISVEEMIEDFSNKRYGALGACMNRIWQGMLPFIKQSDWGGFTRVEEGDPNYIDYFRGYSNNSFWTTPVVTVKERLTDKRFVAYMEKRIRDAKKELDAVVASLRVLCECPEIFENEFSKRDGIDLARTAAGRFLDYLMTSIILGDKAEYDEKVNVYFELLDALRELLGASEDFSLYASLESLKRSASTNPNFEITLKKNNGCHYNRTFVYEIIAPVYYEEAKAVFEALRERSLNDGIDLTDKENALFKAYLETPLASLRPDGSADALKATRRIGDSIQRIKKYI